MRTNYVTVVEPMVFLIVSTFVPSPIMETKNQTGHRYHEVVTGVQEEIYGFV